MQRADVLVRDALAEPVLLDVAQAGEVVDHLALRAGRGRRALRPSSARARTSSSVSGLPSMAVEAWALRVRVSFCSAGIHASSTEASWMRCRSMAISSTVARRAGRDGEARLVGHTMSQASVKLSVKRGPPSPGWVGRRVIFPVLAMLMS